MEGTFFNYILKNPVWQGEQGFLFNVVSSVLIDLRPLKLYYASECIPIYYRCPNESLVRIRRGQVKKIRSDNGTNFVGADRELKQAINDWNVSQIHEAMLQRNIQ